MLKSLSSILLLSSDLKKSKEFYKKLGLIFVSEENGILTFRLNWFKIQILDKKSATIDNDANVEPKGAGVYIYFSTDDVDKLYSELKKKGLKPSSEPKNWPWGNREFAIKDPDGYRLVLYQVIG